MDGSTGPVEETRDGAAEAPSDGTRESAVEGGPERRTRSSGWIRWPRRVVVWILAALALLLGVVNWTAPGQEVALETALARIQGVFAGELVVEGVRSSSLLGGATLVGVRLTTGDERPFLSADSIRARWSLRGLLLGQPRLSSVTAWGLRVEISRYTEDQAMTVARLLPPSAPRADSVAGRPSEIGLGRVRLEGALLEILTPAPDADEDTPGTVTSPSGEGRLSRLALEGLDVELDRTVLRLGGAEPFSAFLARIATEVTFQGRTLELVGGEGLLAFGPRGLGIDDGHFRFPGTVLTGRLELGPRVTEEEAWAFATELITDGPGSLADLRWIDPRVPDGSFQGEVAVTVGDRVDVALTGMEVDLEASDLLLEGGVTLDDGVRMRDFRVEASPLVLGRLEPWLERDLSLAGFLTGTLTLDGPLTALRTEGRVTLAPGEVEGGPTTAHVSGVLHAGSDPGASNLELRLAPLNFGVVDAVRPGVVPPGSGRALLTASGRLSSGLRVVADVSHGTDSLASRVVSRGSVRRGARGRWDVDLLTDLTPFSLELLSSLAPGAGARGLVRGSVRTVGPLDSLRVLGGVDMAGGEVDLDAELDVRAPASRYRLEAELRAVAVSEVSARVPAPSLWTGRLFAEGRGLSPDSIRGRLELSARASRVGYLHVDSVDARVRAADGLLTVDTLRADVGGVRIQGGGSLGLQGERMGEATLSVGTDDLSGLRPLLLGDTVIARDTLTVMDRELLRFEGIDPDTLPDTASVAMSGALEAEVRLWGWLESFGVEGSAVLTRGVYGMDRADSVAAVFRAEELPSVDGAIEVELNGLGIEVEERSFQELHGVVSMEGRSGAAEVEVVRRPGERLLAEGDFALDNRGAGEVGLARARLELDTLVWETAGPSRIAWDASSVSLREVELRRGGAEPMRLTAEGVLAWGGESDLAVEVDGLRLGLLSRLLQLEETALGGATHLSLSVRGPSRTPVIDGEVRWIEPRYGDVRLDSLSGALRYRNQEAEVDLSAWDAGRLAFVTRGTVPVDLALDSAVDRTVDRPMDLRVEADSLSAADVLSFLSFLEDVDGGVSGEFDIGGSLDEPEPRGVFRLEEGAWTMEALGVRHQAVNGSLTLSPDRTVAVELSTRSGGSSTIRGTVTLEPLTNPRLDLRIGFDRFQAVSRADIAGRISGNLGLTGSYREPLVQGDLTVDQGTLFLEEFARAAEVVDLSDPRILEVVDTTALSTRPILAGVRNPFLEKLRVDIDLSVPRDTWLRSSDMNVEMGGDLLVTYDRTSRDLVLVGELQALRGSYAVLGRTFQVQSGTVGFIGTPGINPALDIEAVARIREREGDPLDVTATVEGNLTQPRVQLSSEDAGLAESDLVSYLIFGRPSYELSTGRGSLSEGGGLLGAAAYGGVTWATGTLANRLGSALAREVGVDYLNVTQAGEVAVASGVLSGTQVEVGQYVTDDVFLVLILRPTADQGSQGVFAGARVEWSLNDPYTVEAFVEDQFLRSGVSGFGDLGFETSRILGVFIFREWGY